MKAVQIILLFCTAISLQVFAAPPSIVSELQEKLKTQYLPHLQDQLGKCEEGNCLRIQNKRRILKTPSKDVCFPYTDCEFYKCMEDKYKCMAEGVNYFEELAYPTCRQYRNNIQEQEFTEQGVEWIYSVMVCLQKGLVDECDVAGNCQRPTRRGVCDHITKFTLEFHPGCYIKSGVGVCHLPLKDKLAIWKTVAPFLTAPERRQAYRVVFLCLWD
jgi:hypothetical protein